MNRVLIVCVQSDPRNDHVSSFELAFDDYAFDQMIMKPRIWPVASCDPAGSQLADNVQLELDQSFALMIADLSIFCCKSVFWQGCWVGCGAGFWFACWAGCWGGCLTGCCGWPFWLKLQPISYMWIMLTMLLCRLLGWLLRRRLAGCCGWPFWLKLQPISTKLSIYRGSKLGGWTERSSVYTLGFVKLME